MPPTPVERAGPEPERRSSPGERRRRWLELGVLLAVLAGAVWGAVLWSSARAPAPGSTSRRFDVSRPAQVAPAPELELSDLEGRLVRLRDLRGRVVLLNFWATWCPPCREELPAIDMLGRELSERGLTVFAVNYQEPREVVRAFLRREGLSVPVLLDGDGAAARRYNVAGLPATFLIGRDGALVGSVLGYRDWKGPAARAYLDELLAGSPRKAGP